ncbi:TPA: phage protein NinX family protein [Morganella morganii]
MNKYHDKSDFEINKAVAECKYGIGCTGKTQGGDVIVFTDSFTAIFDPCNNPADAMPIIIENGISLISDWNEIGVWGATNQPWFTSENKNPLRAAMEVFLMMKEAENE